MNESFVVAQGGTQTPGEEPTRSIKLTKPANGEAVIVHASYDGSVFIDFSAIANEKITLVHVGEELVILFDNQSTLTIDPFFDAKNMPLPNLTVEVAPGDDLTAGQFASTFPITDDQSILPAAGGNTGASASGENFTGPFVDPLNLPTPLPLLGPETLGNFVVTFELAPVQSGATAISLTGDVTSGLVDEGGLSLGTPGDIYGAGNDPGAAIAVSGSVAPLVDFGSSGTGTPAFQFVSQTAASNWIAGLGFTSHGEAVDTATITVSGNTETLTASTSGNGAHEVFTLSLNEATGAWTFTLVNPFDDPNPGHNTPGTAVEDSIALDLSGLVQVTDGAGDTLTLSNDFTVTVIDDIPVVESAQSTGAVDEGGLTSGTPGDLYGTGNDSGAATSVSGSLASLISFGADGPDVVGGTAEGFQFVSSSVASTWLAGLDLTSHGSAIDTATISISGNVETLTASAADGHEVFTLALNETTGAWTFTLINPLDQPAGQGENTQAIDLSGLVQAIDYDGDSVTLSNDFIVTVTDDVPVVGTADSAGTVYEAGLASGTPGDLYGTGNDSSDPISVSGSLATLVEFGADGPAANAFQFITASAASTWLAGLDLTSHGSSVDTATISTSGNTETLTASAADGHEVFTLSLNEATGAWTFTLINPFDDPNPGHDTPGAAVVDSVSLDLSGLVQATDFDGDSVTLTNDFAVTVIDDIPVVVLNNGGPGQSSQGFVDEGGLTSGTPGDLYGTGNDPGAAIIATGSLASLVHFGADGPDVVGGTAEGFQFVSSSVASTWLAGLDLTSHGSAIDTATISISGNVETLTASAADGHEVFTLALNETTGAWTFTLINPLDQPAGQGENTQAIDLSGLVQAIDYDGDSVTLANDFIVTVTDDVPTVVPNNGGSGQSSQGFVDEGGLTLGTPGDLYGTGNDPGAAVTATGLLTTLIHFGADGPAADAFQFITASAASTWLASLDLTSHGSAIDTATISISGNTETLTASAADGHEVFTLALNETTGAWTFTLINPLDQPAGQGENTQAIDLSGLVQAVDFDGDAVTLAHDFFVTVTDDVPTVVLNNGGPGQSSQGFVDEGGLSSGTPGDLYGTGNEPGAAITATGSLMSLIHFGADGPGVNAFEFISASAASTWLASLGLTSHGSAINTATIATSGSVETLTASTSGAGAHEVFTLALNESTGTWTFSLINPLDQAAGHGANTQTIDLSGLVQAVDYDGDAVTLAHDFFVTVTDDVPVASEVTGTMAENANTTVTLNSVDFAFGADGPAASNAVTFNTAGATISGPAGETFGTPTYVVTGDSIEIDPGTAFAALTAGQTATLTIPYTVTDFDGDHVSSSIVETVQGPPDIITTSSIVIDADGTAGSPTSAGPEATTGLFSIPVLALLAHDSDALGLSPLDFKVTSVSGTETGLSLTADHNYVLFPLGGSGSFQIEVSDGTTTSMQTVTIDNVSGPVSGSATPGNDFLIENLAAGENVYGDAGNDILVANTSGGSQLYGGNFTSPVTDGGNDFLVGSSAGDNLYAGPGNDTLWGRGGGDQLDGNTVANTTTTFYFQSAGDGGAVINNFDSASGQNDVIAISASGFGGGLSAGANVSSVFVTEANSTFPSTTDRFLFDTANHALYYSADGSTAHEVLLATVTNHTVVAGDIHVVG